MITSVKLTDKPSRFIIFVTGLWVKFLIIVLKRYFISIVLFAYFINLYFFFFSLILPFSLSPLLPSHLTPHTSHLTPHTSHLITHTSAPPPGSLLPPSSFASSLSVMLFQRQVTQPEQISTNSFQFYMQNFSAICALHRRKEDTQL